MDFQPPPPPPAQGYMRPPAPPPPPSMADPHQRPPPPPPPNQPWYSTTAQFQYQHHSPSPPPPPPPSQQQQWAAPPPYPAPHPPYPAHHYPPPPPPPSYPQVNQDWAHANWGHHQNWEYQAHKHEEDWAAKARAWAAAKAASDNQQPPSQFAPAGRSEEQSHYHDQFVQSVESHYPDMQNSPLPPASYQQQPVPGIPQHQASIGHPQQFASFSSGQSSYGNLAGDSAAAFPQQDKSSANPSSYQQEVPSSYSSIAGTEDAGETGKYYMSSSLPVASAAQHRAQPLLPAGDRSLSIEPQYTYGGQAATPATSHSDQPLDFAPRFNHDYESHVQSTYSVASGPIRGVDTISSVPSNYNWAAPAGSGVVYPPMPPVPPPASQVGPSVVVPPPAPGHSAPMFGRLPVPSFQPTATSIDAPFSVGAGAALQPTAAFPSDAFGISSVPERPKKASVPNWLREEIIKKKAVISSSTLQFPRDDNHSIEDETTDKSYGKGEQADSKSIDSSRSTEEEDDDEDDVEAARTAAINQEIKRVLTEVLLKVTDDLFDEIATRVLNEDDHAVDDDRSIDAPNDEVPASSRAAPTVKAEAKVLVPANVKEDDSDGANEKSTSSSPGDVLGLASYASDDEEDNKVGSSTKPNSKENADHLESTSSGNLTGKNLVENGVLLKGTEEHMDKSASPKIDTGRKRSDAATVDHSYVVTQSCNDTPARELVQGDELHSSKFKSLVEEKEMLDGLVPSISKETVGDKIIMKTERPGEPKMLGMDYHEGRESRKNSDRSARHENKSSVEKDYVKEEKICKDKVYEKGGETHRRHDKKHEKKLKMDDQNGSKDKAKEKGNKSGDKAKDSDSRKRASSPSDVKESKRGAEKERKADKEESAKKKERKDDKKERSRDKNASDSSRHKRRRRSSSVESRGRDSRDSSEFNQANDANNESFDDSRRMRHSRRRGSPSPVRSKRRQVSRSPHSKHSQRRHSPYSSLDTARGKRSRSRSRSPIRRKR